MKLEALRKELEYHSTLRRLVSAENVNNNQKLDKNKSTLKVRQNSRSDENGSDEVGETIVLIT